MIRALGKIGTWPGMRLEIKGRRNKILKVGDHVIWREVGERKWHDGDLCEIRDLGTENLFCISR